jgi:hypothetical protein
MDIKRDILGRELHDNDLVVIKGSGGYESAAKPMEVGIFLGKSVRTMTATRTARDMFLIENPGSMELSLKNAILKKIADEKAASKAKQSQKNKQAANVIGRIYKVTKDEEILLYCGKKRVTIYKDGAICSQEEGHLYLSAGRWIRDESKVPNLDFRDFIANEERVIASFGMYHEVDVLKNYKKFAKEFHTVSVPDSFQFTGTHKWSQGVPSTQTGIRGTQWIEHIEKFEIVVESI